MVKRIAVVTGTRAEFGLLEPLLKKIVGGNETELRLIVTGMHLSPEFGMTAHEIKSAGYEITDEIEILLSSDSAVGTAKSVGLATIGFADSLKRLQPDWLVVLGDRFEVLAAATAAMLIGVPIAHIHGGERTDGVIDESIRHSVTKMAAVHFVSTRAHRRRVIQLGESPDRVHHVGAIGLDRILYTDLLPKARLAQDLSIRSDLPWGVVTFHPVTLEPETIRKNVDSLISALSAVPDMFFIVTKANADESGRTVNQMLAKFVEDVANAALFDSLGSLRYLSCVSASEVVVGNSSSGIIEAPFLHTATVDIGIRQKGRDRGASVIQCDTTHSDILDAIQRARSITEPSIFDTSPYFNGGAVDRIIDVIKGNPPPRVKPFLDLEFRL